MKKYLIPILITIIVAFVIGVGGLFYFKIFESLQILPIIKYIILGVVVISFVFLVMALLQRIKELKEENKDDFSKY